MNTTWGEGGISSKIPERYPSCQNPENLRTRLLSFPVEKEPGELSIELIRVQFEKNFFGSFHINIKIGSRFCIPVFVFSEIKFRRQDTIALLPVVVTLLVFGGPNQVLGIIVKSAYFFGTTFLQKACPSSIPVSKKMFRSWRWTCTTLWKHGNSTSTGWTSLSSAGRS